MYVKKEGLEVKGQMKTLGHLIKKPARTLLAFFVSSFVTVERRNHFSTANREGLDPRFFEIIFSNELTYLLEFSPTLAVQNPILP